MSNKYFKYNKLTRLKCLDQNQIAQEPNSYIKQSKSGK